MTAFTDVTGHQVDQYFLGQQIIDRLDQAQNGDHK